jgi:hypothetical protein
MNTINCPYVPDQPGETSHNCRTLLLPQDPIAGLQLSLNDLFFQASLALLERLLYTNSSIACTSCRSEVRTRVYV